MSKVISLTDEVKKSLLQEFWDELQKAKVTTGSFEFKRTFSYKKGEKDSARIMFTPEAFTKQLVLIQNFQKEIGWHGLIRRDPEDEFTFRVEDIMVYPQEVTGTTITPSQEEYSHWHDALPDDKFDLCRYHAHSHVNMSTSPSGVDTGFQSDILQGMGTQSFYVFMIWNKRGEHWASIYDNKNNVLFDTAEITVGVDGGEYETKDFVADAQKLVRERSYVAPTCGVGYRGSYIPSQTQMPVAPAKSPKAKTAEELANERWKKWQQSFPRYSSFLDDPGYDDYGYGGRYD